MHHRDRLAQARHQLSRLGEAERAYLDTHPYRLVHEHDMRAGQYRVRVDVAQPMPDELTELTGEVLRELHASLDELAAAQAGAPTRFPIFESLPLFAQRARKA